jgi:hypothetical protein
MAQRMQVALLCGLFLGTLGNSPAIKEDIESEIDYTDGEEAALAKSKSNEFNFVVEHSMGTVCWKAITHL